MTARQTKLFFLVFIVFAVALRITQLNSHLWFDEVLRTKLFLNLDIPTFANLLKKDCHGLMYNFILAVWTYLFGDSEFSIRTPSLIFSLASACLILNWAKKYLSTLHLALFAFVIGLHPFHVLFSAVAKNNSFVMLVCVLLFVSYDKIIESNDPPPELRMILLNTLAIITDFSLVLPLIAIGLYLNMKKRQSAYLKSLLFAYLVNSPFILYKFAYLTFMFRPYTAPSNLSGYLDLFGSILPMGLHLRGTEFIIVQLLLTLGLIFCLYKLYKSGLHFVLYFFVFITAIYFVAGNIFQLLFDSNLYLPRTIASLIIYPYFFILIYGLSTLKSRWASNIGCVLLLSLNLFGYFNIHTSTNSVESVVSQQPDIQAYVLSHNNKFNADLIYSNELTYPIIQYYVLRNNLNLNLAMIPYTPGIDSLGFIQTDVNQRGLKKFYILDSNITTFDVRPIVEKYKVAQVEYFDSLRVYKLSAGN